MKFIISRYQESIEWIHEYTEDYLIFNKGEPLGEDSRIVSMPNMGGNIRDIPEFIYENYDNLPDLMLFCQAYPFDHCKKDVFDNLIKNNYFTPLEYYGSSPANSFEGRTKDGSFLERNNDWYIVAHDNTFHQACKYRSFDQFMCKYFSDYEHVEWIRFSPGCQYIVPKKNGLFYPRKFWDDMRNNMDSKYSTEAHLIERAMYYILTNKYTRRIIE